MLTVGVSTEVRGVHLVQLKVREQYFAKITNGEHASNLEIILGYSMVKIVYSNTSVQNAGSKTESQRITQKHQMIVPTRGD